MSTVTAFVIRTLAVSYVRWWGGGYVNCYCLCNNDFAGLKCERNITAERIEQAQAEAARRKNDADSSEKNKVIAIAVTFSLLGVIAGGAAVYFYMRRKSHPPASPTRKDPEHHDYDAGNMMFTNPAYSKMGDEEFVDFSCQRSTYA
ncbi:predicted protein [Nematostella vectensis]|uniref:EGF-like domain-containing protein n=1 Tax=Nematostella vectensis TaxID=45351 RepID=A7SL34_NEMVE|nr:predicted protein [Nematostella vectensis]|eukprot:XP_001627673.1 predicted protein [Nematostella vectensis]